MWCGLRASLIASFPLPPLPAVEWSEQLPGSRRNTKKAHVGPQTPRIGGQAGLPRACSRLWRAARPHCAFCSRVQRCASSPERRPRTSLSSRIRAVQGSANQWVSAGSSPESPPAWPGLVAMGGQGHAEGRTRRARGSPPYDAPRRNPPYKHLLLNRHVVGLPAWLR
ncbi:hypothetical protein HPB47_020180 [Ixodes persulcatus]|uniref:Uncharacterized protein n=1 Tax=Ixodes persulcatus TaxID=34615 RepID=A0AC60QGC1_IXOPE|nr:hypothetical protein HPB47_020180 [Ixodes persulcatus]